MTPPVLGQRRAVGAAAGLGDGRPPARARLAHAVSRRLATGSSSRSRRRSCSGPAGRSSSAAGRRFVNRSLNMFTLIALGVGVAYVYSVVATSRPGIFPAAFRDHDGPGRRLLRGGGGDHHAGAARPGARAPRARAHRRRDPGAAGPGAQDRAARARRRRRRGRAARRDRGRRSAARPPGREDSGRRRGARRPQHGRRVDDDRRADAGREGAGRPGHRRHASTSRQLRDARRAGRRATPCSPRSCRWSPRRSARARRSSAWPTWSRAGSCRR